MDKVSSNSYGIFGAGAIGSAIGSSLQKTGAPVVFWDKEKSRCSVPTLNQFTKQATHIIICLPSWLHPGILEELASYIQDNHVIISVAKGVGDDFIRVDEMLAEQFADRNCFGLMDGPMLADEVQAGRHGYAMFALSRSECAGSMASDCSRAGIILRATDDLKSTALCAVLKNIYALAFGIHDGLGLGANSKGALAVMVLNEMKEIMHHFQADETFITSYAGLGDLLATGWSELSYNHRIGKSLAAGLTADGIGGEGVHALGQIHQKLSVQDFTILQLLDHIINYGASPKLLNEILD